ncbi:hypothetical protein Pint_31458 [Pistacia integerrima]|uniref:Uncharacterized protein n=1 Tax=Pistacia integerrima TaxID=434235 RepID=A0ACC0XTC9_9ROSI|nr:hypothetical protein Pint_31458 [Pistacia integerrima]
MYSEVVPSSLFSAVDIPIDISKLINMQCLLMVKCCPPPLATTFLALHPKVV